MTSRAKGTVYRLTLTFPLCINPWNLIYHTFLLNDIKMMIFFLLLSRLWWGTFSPPFRKIPNGSQSCLFTFACTATMWTPWEGLPLGGQRGAAPSCKLPQAKRVRCCKVGDATPAITPPQRWALAREQWQRSLRWKCLQLGHPRLCRSCAEAVLPAQTEAAVLDIRHLTRLLAQSSGTKHVC